MVKPIGIFDSGVGGTSIWSEIHHLLPNEHTIYLADSRNAPYGERSKEDILQLSIKNTQLLLDMGCKLIVVACNTATTNTIDYLRATYDVPFIGIEPAIKPAALQSKTKKVGVLATKGTLTSALFHKTSKTHASDIQIFEREGVGLVQLVEAGKADSEEAQDLLRKYVSPMLSEGIDNLVLGCTHYPYLIPTLNKILPGDLNIIDSGYAVAKQTKTILVENGLENGGAEVSLHRFYSNSDPEVLSNLIGAENRSISYLDY